MAAYRARMMDAVSDDQAVYEFEGPEDLMNDTPVRVVRAFMEHTDRSRFATPHLDWELNAAFKTPERGVVTCMGAFHLAPDQPPAPFLLMIERR